ncbi:MAG: LysR family substrate-binding domain-containing protein [Sphingomonas sp.]|uniref:LysR family substrate-binding domain-containing protein n=1 Tax=Sphingomonas sp. TaxID=28214 RepID=UPI0025F74D11|nr:LysR family substrate-binding domain-containing protein [Sphingomonas sp.]MBX3566049.1 LysR family substrate-binding domain-containing protein [Sphingomonas sp.]
MRSATAGSGTITAGTGEKQHDLAVGCFASICRDRLADELLEFSRVCPKVDIGVHEMGRGALLASLRRGDLSLAVLPGGDEPGTRSQEVWHDRVMVAVPHGHRLAAAKAAVLPSDLRDQPVLVSRQQYGSDMHRFLAGMILPAGAALDATIVDVGPARLVDRVAAGAGVTLICESHVAHLAADVTVLPVFANGARFPVRAYWTDAEPEWPLSALIGSLTHR